MKVILIYDIETIQPEDQQRLTKAKKIARKYLYHVQKSVFEGELTPSQIARLEAELKSVVDFNRDSVIIYTLPEGARWERKILTRVRDPTGNVL